MEEQLQGLANLFCGRDWFHSTGLDQYGRFVVYVNYMGLTIFQDVPDFYAGKQVLCHFAASKTASASHFKKTFDKFSNYFVSDSEVENTRIEDSSSFSEKDLSELRKELVHLERICGLNALESIFYEEHDGNNAITNLSDKFPDVRKVMGQLYEEYGFDVIYEELDG